MMKVAIENGAVLCFVGFLCSGVNRLSPRQHTNNPKTNPCQCWMSEAENLEQITSLEYLSQPHSRSAFLGSLVSIPLAAHAAVDENTRLDSLSEGSVASGRSKSSTSSAKEESLSGFVAGAALAATKTIVKYPLDTATVRLQLPNSAYSIRDLFSLFSNCYNGVSFPLLSNIPAGAVFFAVKDATKASLSSSDSDRWVKTCVAVAVAQVPYWIVRNPSEVIKTRQQAGLPGYMGEDIGPRQAIQRVSDDASREDGGTSPGVSSAFYKGYWENILYAYPADVIKFLCYDQLTNGRKDLAPKEGALAGAIATGIAQFATTPLDVVRNRVMVNTKGGGEGSASYVSALAHLARREGLSGLFAGVSPRVAKALISGAIQFATYEETKQEIASTLTRRRTSSQ